jgi:DNA polymerase-3 subunit gamma/tau
MGHLAYRHHLKIPNGIKFYTSEKHTSRYRDRQQPPLRNIVSIEYIGEEDCQCIMVDHPDHTYISDDFIPTHNTTLSRLIAKSLNGSTDNLIEIDAASHSGVDDMRELVQQASQYPVGTKYKIFLIDEVHSLSSAAWQSLLKCLEEQLAMTVFIMATTNPEKIPETILSRVQSFKLVLNLSANIAPFF